jgi:SEC-C motif-containing protein
MSNSPGPCPCGSGRSYGQCCEPLHQGAPAPNAEALMRSRYSAYALGFESYLLETWHPSTRPDNVDLGSDATAPTWLGLEVQRYEQPDADSAIVEFVARYRVGGGSAKRLHEVSRFVREDGRWYYVTGEAP